ncbi:MAG: hypothetical protein IKB02_04060 [Clostridia bacterium]|nr:hypothetical protein [Clostridia bacterium]
MKDVVFSRLAAEKSLLEELWDYFVEYYLEADAVYFNLGMEGNSMVSLPIILAGFCIGAMIAVFAVMHDSRVIGSYVRRMLEGGKVGRENSVTLFELGTNERSEFARALRRSVTLRRYVRCVEEEDFEATRAAGEVDEKTEYKHVEGEHYYIPEEKRIGAEFKYIKRGVKWWVVPIIVLALVVVFFGLMLLLPYILSVLDSIVGSWKGGM